jgi:hypothetical protein
MDPRAPRQAGLGWGKGRPRVIKTIVRGDALTRALARQQDWVDYHEAREALQDHKAFRAEETAALQAENRTLRRRLRMAKADLPLRER